MTLLLYLNTSPDTYGNYANPLGVLDISNGIFTIANMSLSDKYPNEIRYTYFIKE